jgi:hypothetical protein
LSIFPAQKCDNDGSDIAVGSILVERDMMLAAVSVSADVMVSIAASTDH